ncbi:MAG: DUF971 domain-containing protein [Alphaproteobacteria bacterium]|nr:DUF971 domain-containing protein [Alphaproteobacteria bacterium]
MTQDNSIRPTELRVSKDKRTLSVRFDVGSQFALPAEALRVLSPSAEVQGHSPSQRVTVPGKKNVQIIGVEPVGNYAVMITFDDMHNTGIFTWKYLWELGTEFESRWSGYLAELESKGMTRDRAETPR